MTFSNLKGFSPAAHAMTGQSQRSIVVSIGLVDGISKGTDLLFDNWF